TQSEDSAGDGTNGAMRQEMPFVDAYFFVIPGWSARPGPEPMSTDHSQAGRGLCSWVPGSRPRAAGPCEPSRGSPEPRNDEYFRFPDSRKSRGEGEACMRHRAIATRDHPLPNPHLRGGKGDGAVLPVDAAPRSAVLRSRTSSRSSRCLPPDDLADPRRTAGWPDLCTIAILYQVNPDLSTRTSLQ